MRKFTEKCLNCEIPISMIASKISIKKNNIYLCLKCQQWLKRIENETTYETLRLYFSLKTYNISAKIEEFDGYKHIDIAIPTAKIHIEVDGRHHNYNAKQAMRDLNRTFYSFLNGYTTIRIPNVLTIDDNTLDKTAEILSKFIKEAQKKQG